MDDSQFDALTRKLSSRRTVLVGLVGSVAAVLGFGGAEEGSAHNPLPACKNIKDPRKRLACLRRARAHKRKKHSCKPKPPATFCTNRCGTTQNNCKKKVTCACSAGKSCLANNGCNRTCLLTPSVPCPDGCQCGVVLSEAPTTIHCYPSTLACSTTMLPCVTSANCPRGFFCGLVCGGPGEGRCLPNCPF